MELTASVGWAIYPDDAQTLDELVAAADFCVRREDDGQEPRSRRWTGHRPPSLLGVRPLRVLLDYFPDDPAFDTAVSQRRCGEWPRASCRRRCV